MLHMNAYKKDKNLNIPRFSKYKFKDNYWVKNFWFII